MSDRGLQGVGYRPITPISFVLPSMVFILAISIYPTLTGIYYSTKSGNFLQLGHFVGLANYGRVLTLPSFWHSVGFTALFSLFGVFGSYAIGLLLALLLDKDVIGRGFFRVVLLVPWVIPSVVSIAGWRWLIGSQSGFVNTLLGYLGIHPVLFLANSGWAIASVIVVKVWRSYPFMMVTMLAQLQSIDRNLYEASAIDGANPRQTFLRITLPHLMTVSIVSWILMTIWSVNDFDTIWLLTQGGPSYATENLILLAYRWAFSMNQVGVSSAIAVITLVVLMALATLVLRDRNKS